jgi:outer membrane receptor protein involved in Fe transport
MKVWMTLMGLIFSGITLLGQDAVVTGTVTENGSEPLISVTVRSGESGTITDLDGNYELTLPPGKHTVVFSYVGYAEQRFSLSLSPGEKRVLNVDMEEAAAILQTATVTSGKYEKPLGEVTVSLEVLKPQLVESVNATSLDEVLEKVPGVNIIDGQANIRGGSGFSYGAGSRVLLLVDDIPMLQADAGFPNWDDLPVENVEQIEVVKGAASALYGSSALNGIINIRTAYAKSEPEFKASLFHTVVGNPSAPDQQWRQVAGLGNIARAIFQTDDTRKWWNQSPYRTGASLSYKRKIQKLDLVAGTYVLKDQSFNQRNFENYQRATLGLRYRFSDRLTAGFNSNFNQGDSQDFFFWAGNGAQAYQGSSNAYTFSERLRFNIDPYVNYYDPLGNRHKLMGRVYRVENNVSNNQSNESLLYYGEYQFQRKFERIGMVATAGVVISGTEVAAPLYGDTTYTSENQAGYVQLDQRLFDRLNLSAGFRYEANQINNPGFDYFNGIANDTIFPSVDAEAKPVFRLGANLRITDYTFLRASWGQGYRYPTIAEKFIVTTFGGVPISPNPELQSETGWSAEVGLKQGFKVSGFEGFIDLAAFWSEYQDMMEFTFVNLFPTGFQSQNIGGTSIRGLEATIAGRGNLFGAPTNVLAGYTFIDPRFLEFDPNYEGLLPPQMTQAQLNAFNSSIDENILKYRNRHTFKFDMESKFGQFSAGLAVFYSSHMDAIDRIFEVLVVPGLREFREQNDNGWSNVGIRLGYSFDDKKKISFLANNLFNEAYSVRPGLLEMPRNFTVRLDYGF